MKRVPLSTLIVGSAVVSIAMVYSTDLPARDKSGRGASVSSDRGGVSVGRGEASVSADRGGASAGAGDASATADSGGASAGAGNASATADPGGASADRDDADVGRDGRDKKVPAAPVTASGRPVGDRSYDSLGEWFADLRAMFTGKRKDADMVTEEASKTVTRSSATHTAETSDPGRTQENRVVQKQSSIETATEDGSASAEASNVSDIEQNN